MGVPLYGSVAARHDYVVQARGAFDQTVLGVQQLGRFGFPVEIRVVVHAATAGDLLGIADYVYRNFPFAVHVAWMGLEPTGFAIANWEKLWIEPGDYAHELEAAVEYLAMRGMNVSIYNHPLCLLRPPLWRFARKSISDWKNIYLDVCDDCVAKDSCTGFFASGTKRHSTHVTPIRAFSQA
jgi:His-Xaa-Ser system radical SAM maturase HxsC